MFAAPLKRWHSNAETVGGPMGNAVKFGIVAVGYVLSVLIGIAAVELFGASRYLDPVDASGGMAAFGDLLLFCGAFGTAALVPTGAGLFFLRKSERFWSWTSKAGLLLAVTGVTAAVLFATGRNAEPTSALFELSGVSVLRMLASPLLVLAFLLSGAVASFPRARAMLWAAALLEILVSAFAGFIWFLPLLLQRR